MWVSKVIFKYKYTPQKLHTKLATSTQWGLLKERLQSDKVSTFIITLLLQPPVQKNKYNVKCNTTHQIHRKDYWLLEE